MTRTAKTRTTHTADFKADVIMTGLAGNCTVEELCHRKHITVTIGYRLQFGPNAFWGRSQGFRPVVKENDPREGRSKLMKRTRYSAEFKARRALDAIREELTLAIKLFRDEKN